MVQAYEKGIENTAKDVVKKDIKDTLETSANAGLLSFSMNNTFRKSEINEKLFTKEVNNIVDAVNNQFETITNTDVSVK